MNQKIRWYAKRVGILIAGVLVLNMSISTYNIIRYGGVPLEIIYEALHKLGDWRKEDLRLERSGYRFGFFRVTAEARFKIKGEGSFHEIYISIYRPLGLLDWKVSEYKNELLLKDL